MKKYLLFFIIGHFLFGFSPFAFAQGGKVLSLDALRDSALQHNVAIRVAHLGVEAAKQQRREALTNYFPNVSATALAFKAHKGMAELSIDPSDLLSTELGGTLAQVLPLEILAPLASPITLSLMEKGAMAGVNAVQPIFAGGQIVYGNKLARVGEEASELQLQRAEDAVLLKVEEYYWQLVSLEQKRRTLDAVDALLTDLTKDATAAVKAGLVLNNDLLQVQLRQNDVQSQRITIRNSEAVVRLTLSQYCGLHDPNFTIQCPTEEEFLAAALTVQPFTGGEQQALTTLPAYQLLQKQVQAAELQQRMERGKQLPSIAVGAGVNYHNLLDNNHVFGMIFATASVPISDWWGGSHAVRRKRLALQQAQEQLNNNAELMIINMQQTWNDVTKAQNQLKLAQQSIEQARENLRIYTNTYRAGTATMSDLLQAQLLYQQSRDRATDAYIALQTALLSYRQATGQ